MNISIFNNLFEKYKFKKDEKKIIFSYLYKNLKNTCDNIIKNKDFFMKIGFNLDDNFFSIYMKNINKFNIIQTGGLKIIGYNNKSTEKTNLLNYLEIHNNIAEYFNKLSDQYKKLIIKKSTKKVIIDDESFDKEFFIYFNNLLNDDSKEKKYYFNSFIKYLDNYKKIDIFKLIKHIQLFINNLNNVEYSLYIYIKLLYEIFLNKLNNSYKTNQLLILIILIFGCFSLNSFFNNIKYIIKFKKIISFVFSFLLYFIKITTRGITMCQDFLQ
jgi:hypothetical protein